MYRTIDDVFCHVGIDPGASGAVAILDATTTIHSLNGVTDRITWEVFRYFDPARTFAAIEANTGYVGGAGNPGSAMFKFGVSTGKLIGFLVAAGVPFETVTPRTWQKSLGITSRKRTESKSQFKRRLRERAERLFPSVKVTLATADALLIAEWCRRKRKGQL